MFKKCSNSYELRSKRISIEGPAQALTGHAHRLPTLHDQLPQGLGRRKAQAAGRAQDVEVDGLPSGRGHLEGVVFKTK